MPRNKGHVVLEDESIIESRASNQSESVLDNTLRASPEDPEELRAALKAAVQDQLPLDQAPRISRLAVAAIAFGVMISCVLALAALASGPAVLERLTAAAAMDTLQQPAQRLLQPLPPPSRSPELVPDISPPTPTLAKLAMPSPPLPPPLPPPILIEVVHPSPLPLLPLPVLSPPSALPPPPGAQSLSPLASLPPSPLARPPPAPLRAPPPLPPTPPPPAPVVDIVNARFRDGRPSSDLSLAGILIHMFDQASHRTTPHPLRLKLHPHTLSPLLPRKSLYPALTQPHPPSYTIPYHPTPHYIVLCRTYRSIPPRTAHAPSFCIWPG